MRKNSYSGRQQSQGEGTLRVRVYTYFEDVFPLSLVVRRYLKSIGLCDREEARLSQTDDREKFPVVDPSGGNKIFTREGRWSLFYNPCAESFTAKLQGNDNFVIKPRRGRIYIFPSPEDEDEVIEVSLEEVSLDFISLQYKASPKQIVMLGPNSYKIETERARSLQVSPSPLALNYRENLEMYRKEIRARDSPDRASISTGPASPPASEKPRVLKPSKSILIISKYLQGRK